MGMGFTLMSRIFPVLFTTVFVVILVTFIVTAIRGIGTWSKNNASPRLTVSAQVVTKRTNVTRHHGQNGMPHSSTHYYVTFQVESGDRMEMAVSGPEYGMLAEGDQGNLTFQGTRYLSFERT